MTLPCDTWIGDVAKLAAMANLYIQGGRFEDAFACLRLIEQYAAWGREGFGPPLDE